ncbi:MAG: LCP family protein [Clostridiales bacterium]|nr:LCP family protein [Clostridiales bacterium]
MHRRKDGADKKKIMRKLVPLCVAVAVLLVMGVIISLSIDQNTIETESEGTEEDELDDIVEINGIRCIPKKNLKSYLFLGLDSQGESEAVAEYEGTGQCDTIILLVVDEGADIYTMLPLNRDTMTEVDSLDEDGYYLTTTVEQLSFAHTYGDGLDISCENTAEAVSNLLYDQQIDGYASLNMDAIEVLNHLVGGVTVTIEDDFSETDSSLVQGETVTLTDEQAMHYVHDRMNVGDGTNESRMRRQSQYLDALRPLLVEKREADSSFALEIYDSLEDYMVTDFTRNGFINLAADLLGCEQQESPTIEGTNAVGESGFNEFIVDEDSLAEVVIDLFYDRVDDDE